MTVAVMLCGPEPQALVSALPWNVPSGSGVDEAPRQVTSTEMMAKPAVGVNTKPVTPERVALGVGWVSWPGRRVSTAVW